MLREEHADRIFELRNIDLEIVVTALSAEGMSGSIRAGIANLGNTISGAILLLPDMPCVGTEEIDEVIAHAGTLNIVRATSSDGTPGNPVYFPKRYFPENY